MSGKPHTVTQISFSSLSCLGQLPLQHFHIFFVVLGFHNSLQTGPSFLSLKASPVI